MPEEVSADKKVLDLSGEMPLVEGAETDEEILLSRDLISAFIKAVKAFRFYPPDNPTLKGLRDQLLRKFQSPPFLFHSKGLWMFSRCS